MDTLEYKFTAEVQKSSGRKSTYFFLLVPKPEGKHISHFASHLTRGFKSLKVRARIGKTEWLSSIFPSNDSYLLLLNKEVRGAEKLEAGGDVKLTLTILGL